MRRPFAVKLAESEPVLHGRFNSIHYVALSGHNTVLLKVGIQQLDHPGSDVKYASNLEQFLGEIHLTTFIQRILSDNLDKIEINDG